MNTSPMRRIYALFLREWMMMRTWLLSLALIMLAGPVINLINAVGAPQAHKSTVQITTDFKSLYTTAPVGILNSVHHHLAAINFKPSVVPVFIHGAPPASLWVIASATVLGVLLSTIDKQSGIIVDTLSAPVRKQDIVRAKLVLGTSCLVIAIGFRTLVLHLLNLVSPFHFPVHTLLLSGVVNFFVALASFSIVFFIGVLIGNTILAWCLGFLALSFPLALGAVVRVIGHVSGMYTASYNFEHHFLLRLSPFLYTNYNTIARQNFAPSAGNSTALTTPKSIVMYTGIEHPLVLVSGALVVFLVIYWASLFVSRRAKTEHLESLFLSRGVLHASLSLVSIIFGSVTAQIIAHAELWTFATVALFCYALLWVLQHSVLTWLTKKRVSPSGA